jgi:hypothetical protein
LPDNRKGQLSFPNGNKTPDHKVGPIHVEHQRHHGRYASIQKGHGMSSVFPRYQLLFGPTIHNYKIVVNGQVGIVKKAIIKNCWKNPWAVQVASFPEASQGASGSSWGIGQVDKKKVKDKKKSQTLMASTSRWYTFFSLVPRSLRMSQQIIPEL